MEKPQYQIWIENSLRIGAGLFALGALFDAISNSVTLVTPLVTYVGTVILLLSFLIFELRLKRRPIPWVSKDNQIVRLKSIGRSLRYALFGMVLLLWLPRMLNYPKQKPVSLLTVAGQVILDNKPLQNANLTIVGVTGKWTTDENGAFQFQIPAPVQSDSLTLAVRGQDAYAEICHDTTIAGNAATALRLDLITQPTQFIAGQVVEEGTGKPIADVQITLAAGRGNGATDSLGYFCFNALGKPFEAVEATLTHLEYKTTVVGLTISENNRLAIGRKK